MSNLINQEFIDLFGKNLRKIRESKKLSLEKLEELTEIHYNQIGRIERGEINTSINNVHLLSKALDIHPRELFEF